MSPLPPGTLRSTFTEGRLTLKAMFMRNRAHMCNYCSTIDEAHYKRHHELVTQLRGIYESCGEEDWIITPVEPGDPRRGQPLQLLSSTCDSAADSLELDETPASKRERKDAKCLARAASRARVVTQEEIRYMDSIVHSVEGVARGEDASPANVEELQLIEDHLRYNANVFNSHSKRHDLKMFAKIPDVDVDFEGELERVLDTLRITELIKRNSRNRGLQGKELKIFDTLIEKFKNTLVEDLVLVKKDLMEIRMRRAGYLRYINKTAYDIVEDRYADRDWKTGERTRSCSSDSSSTTLLSEEVITAGEYVYCDATNHADVDLSKRPMSNSLPSFRYSAPRDPDRRHLQHMHTRISGDDGLEQKIIEPYHTPLLALTPNTPLKKPAILQLKIVQNKENSIPPGMSNRWWLQQDVPRHTPRQPLQTTEEAIPLPPSLSVSRVVHSEAGSAIEPAWGNTKAYSKDPPVKYPEMTREKLLAQGLRVDTSKSVSTKANAVRPSSDKGNVSLTGPKRAMTRDHIVNHSHPVVSQKKAKKAQRESKRKAKKVSGPEDTFSPAAMVEASLEDLGQGFDNPWLDNPVARNGSDTGEEVSAQSPTFSFQELNDIARGNARITDAARKDTAVDALVVSFPPAIPHTTHGKHDHWMRFSRVFVVDQLTIPLLQSFESCSHGSSCLFESNGVSDCPFHEPHCSCCDPLLNQCYLTHPGKELYTSGPYNQAHGQRLLAMYEKHDLTKGRVMLVDDDLVSYFMDGDSDPNKPDLTSMPPRLLHEHINFLDGYDRGPLMKQELEFGRLLLKNMSTRHMLTKGSLQDIQRSNFVPKDSVPLCYCRTEVSLDSSDVKKEFSKDFVNCSYEKCEFGGTFHKGCVKKLGFEKVSRWYCTACEKKMKFLACKTLNAPYKDDNGTVDGAEEQYAEKTIAKMLAMPFGAVRLSKSRLQELHAAELRGDLEIEDVD